MAGLTLVTGATGFVGSAVARALVARGERVRVTARASSNRANLRGLDAEAVDADVTGEAAMRRALEGCDRLYHVAADYRLWAREPEEIVRNNLAQVRAVMGAALDAGVERIVYTSSVATLVPGHGEVADETCPATPDQAVGAYKRSKVVAERHVEALVAEHGLPAVIVQPSTPIGPRDVKPTPTGRIIVEAATGKIPAFVDTGLNLAHVDDVAAGHLLAMDRGRVGERYILGGDDVSLRAMLGEIARLTGRKPPTTNLPRGPLYPLARLFEAAAKVTGREPMLTVDALNMSRHVMFFSSAKAERELGYVHRPHAEGLADALAWFREAGYLGAS